MNFLCYYKIYIIKIKNVYLYRFLAFERRNNMSLEQPTVDNLSFMLNEIGEKLKVANRGLLDPEDYDLNRYTDIKMMYDIVTEKGQLTASEANAFISELGAARKK